MKEEGGGGEGGGRNTGAYMGERDGSGHLG